MEGSSNFFPNSVSFGVFSHSKGVLCSKWLSPPKRFFGVFPKQFFTFVSQSPAVFWANGCCFRKGSVEGSANYSLHLSPKLLYKGSLEGSASCALHLSPSVLLGSKLRELFTRLTHTNPVRRKQPIMSLLLGYSLGLFFLCHSCVPNFYFLILFPVGSFPFGEDHSVVLADGAKAPQNLG